MTLTTNQPPTVTTDEVADRLFGAVLGAIDAWSIYVGDHFGAYGALVDHGPMTRSELTARIGMHRRYAHEWLEQQVTTGFVTVDDSSLKPDDRRYSIDRAHAEVLTDADSLAYLAPFVRLVVAGGIQLPALIDAYKTGGGVSWEQFGPAMRTGQAEMNRPWFLQELGRSWFPSVPELDERLRAGAKVADIGCGEGWSSIAMAQAYPNVVIDAYDIDGPSIQAARTHAAAAGVADRVTFHRADVAGVADAGPYDVVTAFECIHDMPDPVGVLRAIRGLVADDGHVVVMDEAVADRFGDKSDEVERLMYGFSLFVCLPDGMSHSESVGTGTVMRPNTLEAYAADAGFAGVDTLPIDNDLWRFYRLNLS